MKKKKWMIVGIVLLVLAIVSIVFLICFQPTPIKTTFVVEYGDSVELSKEEVFGDNWLVNETLTWEEETWTYETKQDYLAIGTYPTLLTYRIGPFTKTLRIQITVQDTTPPVFTKTEEEIRVAYGESDHDFTAYFEADDRSQTTISFDLTKVDFQKAGTYEAIAKAEDVAKNQVEFTFSIIVEEKVSTPSTTVSEPVVNDSPVSNQIEPYYVNGILVVNKKHGLPASFAPGEQAEAKAQLLKLLQSMHEEGLQVSDAYSGYRSYEYQKSLYQGYVNAYGQASADTFSARAGYSEHQSGLAFDLLQPNGALLESAAETKWVAEHAHLYGFIVRYPAGKESVTGYMAEPWHIRYIGEQASAIYQSGLTLEEYLGVSGGSSY